jgi:hypothetical protein
MIPNGRAVGAIVPMLHEKGLYASVMLQNSKEFRPAVPTISDNSDTNGHLTEYSSL